MLVCTPSPLTRLEDIDWVAPTPLILKDATDDEGSYDDEEGAARENAWRAWYYSTPVPRKKDKK